MALNIILGIGGTGAKVVEAVLHACAAGLGPENLHVAFIDQDRSNGNVSRSLETLTRVAEARGHWRRQGQPHFIADTDLLRTEVVPIGEGLWIPHREQKANLRDILGDLGEDEHLFDLLFARDTEQTMELDEGYRGRAHIGSTAISSAVARENDSFWSAIFDLLRQAAGGEPVRLMLAGSVFGGTGASGFPTIARLVRRFLARENIGINVSLGGVLMLPYFKFDPPEDEAANVARSEDLLPQTRGALRYYDALFSREEVFDELMMVGWDTSFNLGYHRHGTGDQRNPALLPEFIASLGACRFFDPEHQPQQGVLATAREHVGSFSWSDVPPLGGRSDHVYQRIGKQIRFAAAWKFWAPVIGRQPATWRPAYARHAWFRRFGLAAIDYDRAPPTEAIQAVTRYVDKFIEWAATMQVYAPRGDLRFDLWDLQNLLSAPADYSNPQQPVRVKAALDENEFGVASRSILGARVASHQLTDAAWLLDQLSHSSPAKGTSGLGGFVDALHSGSAAKELNGRNVADARL